MERSIDPADRRLPDDEGDVAAGAELNAGHSPQDREDKAVRSPQARQGLAPPLDHLALPTRTTSFIALAPPDQRSLLWALIGGAVFLALALISLSLGRFDGSGSAAASPFVWLPSGAAVAFLLRARLANEVGFFALILPASVFAHSLHGTELENAIPFSLGTIVGVIATTGLTRRFCGPKPDFRSFPTAMRLILFAGVAGPLVSTATGFLFIGWNGQALGASITAMRWFLTESLGMIMMVPALLTVCDALVARRLPNAQTLAESSALLACSLLCAVLVLSQNDAALLFVIVPMTWLHALRTGGVGVTLHVLLIAAVAGAMSWAGRGPFVSASPTPAIQLHLIQVFLVANLLTGLSISWIMSRRDQLTLSLNDGPQELALLATSITDAVLRLDQDGVCTYASPAAKDVLGEDPSAFIGRPLDALTQEDASHRITDVLSRLLEGKSDKERLTYRRRLDDDGGAPVFIEADCAITNDPATESRDGIIISARDVTERVELELLLTRARRHAEKAASAKSDFLANMSHEIRTPMNGVLGFAELMLQGDLEPGQRRHTEMIVESGRSMMLLLNDILDLSKIEAGQIVIDTGPIDLHATLDECVALHRPSAEEKGVSLTLAYDMKGQNDRLVPSAGATEGCGSLLPTVITDGLRLRQIALNLIGNAVKFTHEGDVRVSYWARENQLCVRVRDTGIGISKSKLDKIFQPFTQGDNGTAQRFGGTGLGLTISRQLAELLGGHIAVESVPGVGSTFTLSMPAAVMEPVDPSDDATIAVALEELPQEARILLVEDHDVNRTLVTEMLERCGQSVAIAQDGNEAISMVMDSVLRDRPFDLILMDIQMPECDGYEATMAIREEGIGPDTLPIIALTANAFPEDVTAAREAGMQAHLAKPIEFAELAKALQRWLPTRIVETPMDRDVSAYSDDDAETLETSGKRAKATLRRQWLSRRSEVIEAVRKALADGLIGNQNRRRAADQTDRADLMRMIHKLAGTAASFGEPDLGNLAAELDHALSRAAPSDECEKLAFALLALADEP